MVKFRKNAKTIAIGATCALLAGALVISPVLPMLGSGHKAVEEVSAERPLVREIGGVNTHRNEMFDPAVVQALPEGLSSDREVSVVVKTKDEGLLAAYDSQKSVTRYNGVAAFADSAAGGRVTDEISRLNKEAERKLGLAGVSYRKGAEYDTLTGGFEVTVKAGEYAKIAEALEGTGATAYISEEYNVSESQVVTNDVNVYGTGIFDSSSSPYDGTGTIVAVLDTGLDYTHSAFDPAAFTAKDEDLAMNLDDIAEDLTSLRAYEYSGNISAADLYINRKVPYGYDYADRDTDVYPLNSEHGTHVSGVILGKDGTITGVAPNAQLAVMKVFSDAQESARWSWILAALEDCVVLDVDVINMSLGTSCGFSVESKLDEAAVYDSIAAHGISLVAAASNDYNSTYGSDKNGNLGLTSNPDSATAGSPGSYTSALSVASISGVKTPYLTYNGRLIYFTEASDTAAEFKNFVDDLFKTFPEGTNEAEVDYQLVPGIGRTADYAEVDVKGKIALVRRGSNTFEDKARVAQQQGAIGVIIYNNVSGDITMNVGFVSIAVCSISMDDGEALAAAGSGKIKISRDQVAGPFMSDFSSWGPTPDLRIKPEITAHGGEILSAVPGQDYERLSGTSMASPNQAGVTSLVRQYVKDAFGLNGADAASRVNVLALSNRLMMCTADIAYNTNGLPYSVRKQGAGLANLTEATTTPAYIGTYDRDTGELMDKAKIELGDDREKTGVYDLKFSINNAFGQGDLTYDADAIVMTEGVSETKTFKGDTTVTEKGYILEGAKVTVENVEGGSQNGNLVTVAKGGSAVVTLRITLGEGDKQYLDSSFANGMYVEGFVTLTAKSGTDISLNVPYLAFYGDWTQAPIFDLDYFETQKDELDDSLETLQKTLPDAYATRPIGGLTEDYISYLGAYYFVQDPLSVKIAADRKYVSLSNQEDSVNSIYAIWAGMLRGAKRTVVTITNAATGEVIFTKEDFNRRKSYNAGGAITFGDVEVEFKTTDYDLKNNTQYNVRLEAYLDYGEDGGASTNKKNVFEFPFVTDFQSPVVTGCDFYTEYDRTAQKNRLYARVSIYDNHYSMAYIAGYMVHNDGYPVTDEYEYDAVLFNAAPQQLYSEFNSETQVTVELTDYVSELGKAAHPNSFVIGAYDFAMNEGLYEINIPDSVKALYFEEEKITLSPNETYILDPKIYPDTEWKETLVYSVPEEGKDIISVVNGQILALSSGETTVTATCAEDPTVYNTVPVKVLSEGEEGYVVYDKPVLNAFRITGYTTNKAFYILNNELREIGTTGSKDTFSPTSTNYALSMYPSEQVTIEYLIKQYYPSTTQVVFTSNNENIVTVTPEGQITAVAEGFSSVSVRVLVDGKPTLYDYTISVTVKNPYEQNGQYLLSYRGNGGKVEIPGDLGLKQIYEYAFSGYEYIPKGPEDEISEEDPTYTKPWYLGEDTITEVVIPEGIEIIGNYAFAGLTALQKVTLPSTLKMISRGAFYGCTSLTQVEGLGHVKFINHDAFAAPDGQRVPLNHVDLGSIIAIGNNAFRNSELLDLTLPKTAQSIGAYAFAGTKMNRVTIEANRVKLGEGAFSDCTWLRAINLVNAYVIPDGAFEGCTDLREVTIGADVSTIGRSAFGGTSLEKFTVATANPYFKASADGTYLTDPSGEELKYVAPQVGNSFTSNVKRVSAYAFSGNTQIASISLPQVVSVGEYAFADTTRLTRVTFGDGLESLGEYAFYGANIQAVPNLGKVKEIPAHAFEMSALLNVNLGNDFTIGESAFANCTRLTRVTLGNNVTVGERAFYCDAYDFDLADTVTQDNEDYDVTIRFRLSDSALRNVTVGNNVVIGKQAFANANKLVTLNIGSGTVGEEAFYNTFDIDSQGSNLTSVDLSGVTAIGARAFSGDTINLYQYDRLVGRITITQASGITEANLAGLKDTEETHALGEGAFANCTALTTVRNFSGVQYVPDNAFHECEALKNIDLSNVVHIGAGAFAYSAIKDANLSKAEFIGDEAFIGSDATDNAPAISLETLTLRPEGCTVGRAAFADNVNLQNVANLEAVTSYGDYAFASTRISGKLDLSKATAIGSFAFGGTGLTEVVFSDALQSIGENPFVDCEMSRFVKTTPVIFNGKQVDETKEYTYDITPNIKVIEGALYRTVPNGLELICLPKNIGEKKYTFKVADNTVRIGAQACYNATMYGIDMPLTVKAIGDKAFYGCKDLRIVIFKSYNAPILEEQYDMNYVIRSHFAGPIAGYEEDGDLGIVEYLNWSPYDTTFFFGANFVDYIGMAAGDLTMVRPENGLNYESFTFRRYFDTVIDGPTAPEPTTLAAIAAIDALPETITLEHEPLVVEARRLYDLIATDVQRALVTNYSKLTAAEATIARLKAELNPGEEPPEKSDTLAIVLGVVFGVLGAAIIAGAVTGTVLYLKKKKNAGAVEGEAAEGETPAEGETAAGEEAEAEALSEVSAAEEEASAEPAEAKQAEEPAEGPAEGPDGKD